MKTYRKEIGFTKEAFHISLLHAHKYWLEKVNTSIQYTKEKTIGEDPYTTKIPLFKYTQKYQGHIGIQELKLIETIISKFESNQPKGIKLSFKQIALIHIYQGLKITPENCKEIAEAYGYTSGKKLKQIYNSLFKTNDRIGNSGTKTKISNMKILIQSVIGHLPEKDKAQPLDEIKTLDSLIEEY